MYGPGGGPCDIKYVTAKLRDRDGTRYTIAGGCYGEGEWVVSLSRGTTLVECDGLKLMYQETGGYWNGVMPRSCLSRLAKQDQGHQFLDRRLLADRQRGRTHQVRRARIGADDRCGAGGARTQDPRERAPVKEPDRAQDGGS